MRVQREYISEQEEIDVKKLSCARELVEQLKDQGILDSEFLKLSGISAHQLQKIKLFELDEVSLNSLYELLVITKTINLTVESTNKLFKIVKE